MTTEILAPTAENLRRAGNLIRAGELVAFPTETVYGLGADGLNEEACRKIYAAKERPADKPLTLHVASFAQIEELAEISAAAEKFIAFYKSVNGRIGRTYIPGTLAQGVEHVFHIFGYGVCIPGEPFQISVVGGFSVEIIFEFGHL